MSYRDDVDTLYTRAMVLQRELDRATAQLAEREAELEALRGPAFSAAETSPEVRAVRALRDLPDPDDVLARLVDATDATPATPVRWLGLPVPDLALSSSPPMSRGKVLERVRDRLGALDQEALLMIGTLIEELGDEATIGRARLLDQLRPIAERITQSFWHRR
ncbi:MAG: hypothetical protein IPQ07_10070 [Myxococcales bacterium]|nr:hypothetical protein [Myxococcales bacterium]